jgi:fatty acid desaturase
MKQIKNFVKHTFKNVPKEKREEIIPIVTESLIEKVEDLIEKGYSEQQAIDQTVLEFGTAEDYFGREKQFAKFRRKTLKHYRNDFLFSLIGAIIIIGMLVFTNLYFFGDILWFVLPAIAVLWWPLAILYRFLNKKVSEKGEDDE